ncbi:methionine--tRNA ligase [Streptomyces sp. NPDC048434]|uniref:methionine--tRNA ligase n=1 Tax=Streptomyces sp. NPDC048434 TaxID=3365549 RepID=UPI0037117F00
MAQPFALVTAAPPTPNGDLHLGHLSGPYSGADIRIRAHRLQGGEGLYMTGSDLHQSYVPTKAAKDGLDPVEMADGYADEIARIFAGAHFEPDAYVRPWRSELHRTIVTEFFARLHQRGALEPRTEKGLYCGSCDRYLFEAHLTGRCPHCDAASDGNSCENCARPNAVIDVVDARCNACGGTPVQQDVRRLVFPLSRYADRLRAFHARAVLSPQLEALCADLIERGLPDVPVTHPSGWGIPMPAPGFEDQRIYVWAEMMPGYFAELAEALAAQGRDPHTWPEVWNAPDTEITQFFGFDNGYFHALLQPALLMAYDEDFRLPTAQVTNEFYQLGDSKFSTSRRHAIWANDLLAAVPADIARFVLAKDRPEYARTSFGWDRLLEVACGELAGTWQGWLTGLFTRLETESNSLVPEAAAPDGFQTRFLAHLEDIAGAALRAYSAADFSPRRATRLLGELVLLADDFAAGTTRIRATGNLAPLVAEAAAARTLAQLAYPVLPDFAAALWTALGEQGTPVWDGVRAPAPGTKVDTARRFFTPLPDDIEQRVMAK